MCDRHGQEASVACCRRIHARHPTPAQASCEQMCSRFAFSQILNFKLRLKIALPRCKLGSIPFIALFPKCLRVCMSKRLKGQVRYSATVRCNGTSASRHSENRLIVTWPSFPSPLWISPIPDSWHKSCWFCSSLWMDECSRIGSWSTLMRVSKICLQCEYSSSIMG